MNVYRTSRINAPGARSPFFCFSLFSPFDRRHIFQAGMIAYVTTSNEKSTPWLIGVVTNRIVTAHTFSWLKGQEEEMLRPRSVTNAYRLGKMMNILSLIFWEGGAVRPVAIKT